MATMVDLEKDLSCAICLGRFTEPKILPCTHRFCQPCLEGHIGAQAKTRGIPGFPCPLCKTFIQAPPKAVLPSQWASLFKTDYLIKNIMDTVEGASTARQCRQHEERMLELYCTSCHVLLCVDCFLHNHRDNHHVVSLAEAASSRRDILKELVERTSGALDAVAKKKEDVGGRLRQLNAERQAIESQINDLLHIAITHLRDRTGVLLKAVADLYEGERAKVTDAERQLEDVSMALRDSQASLSKLVRASDLDTLVRFPLVKSNCQAVLGECPTWNPRLFLATLHLVVDSALQRRLHQVNFGRVSVRTPTEDSYTRTETGDGYDEEDEEVEIYPTLSEAKSMAVENDDAVPDLCDVIVLTSPRVLVATDRANSCLKCAVVSDKEVGTCYRVPLPGKPFGVTQLTSSCVVVSLPDTAQLCTVSLEPASRLSDSGVMTSQTERYLSFISCSESKRELGADVTTSLGGVTLGVPVTYGVSRAYHGLVSTPLGLVATAPQACPPSVDILDLTGWFYKGFRVLRSISRHVMDIPIFVWPLYVTVTSQGHVLVSDWGRGAIVDLDPVWGEVKRVLHVCREDQPRNPGGVAVDSRDNILVTLADEHKVLKLSGDGEVRRTLLTHSDGLCLPSAICVTEASDVIHVVQAGRNVQVFHTESN